MLQVREEIDALATLIRERGCRSLLEVGSKFGGSLDVLARAMPIGSRVVSVDMPGGTKLWRESEPALKGVIAALKADGYDTSVIWGDSTDAAVIRAVTALGPYDAIFIDANHTEPFVRQDWANYGPLGMMVAFHDIAWRRAPEWVGVRIDVPKVWDELTREYPHVAFRFCPTGKNNGIGVLFRDQPC